jgi:hypothetical protein
VYPFGETVVFEAPTSGSDDAHGNPTVSWGAPVSVEGCAFDPGASQEIFEPGRNPVTSSPRVFAPAGTVVSARSRVTVRGLVFVVDGDPAVWVNPYTGSTPGVVVNLERVGG